MKKWYIIKFFENNKKKRYRGGKKERVRIKSKKWLIKLKSLLIK